MSDAPAPKPDGRDKQPPTEGEFKTFVKKMLAVPKAEVDRRHAEKRKGKRKDR